MSPTIVSRIGFGESFVEANGCREWLKTVPLTNLSSAARAIVSQMDRLREAPIRALERMRIAEVLRGPMTFLNSELAKRFAGKPVPQDPREREAADDAMALWHALWGQYSICLKALIDGDNEVRAASARLLQRAIFAGKQQISVHGLARRQLGPKFWRELHAFYRFSEILNVAALAVDDPLAPAGSGVSCYSCYAHALLLALADPYTLSVRDLELTDRWLAMWSHKVNPAPLAPADAGPLLVVDLEGIGGFAVIAAAPTLSSASLRFGQTGKLAQSVRGRIKKLLDGASPGSLKLGEDCTPAVCIPLLKHLFTRWCLVPKRHYSDAVETNVELCGGGLPGLFYRATGRTLRSEAPRDKFTFDTGQRLRVTDAVADYDPRDAQAEQDWPWERWHGVTAVSDATLARAGTARNRWQLSQIVVCREADEQRFGCVSWIAEDGADRDGATGMSMGVDFWPGRTEPVLMRATEALLRKDPPFPGFFLRGEGDAAGAAATLIVPPRTFSAGRRLETSEGPEVRVRLVRLLQRGADFERVAFEPA